MFRVNWRQRFHATTGLSGMLRKMELRRDFEHLLADFRKRYENCVELLWKVKSGPHRAAVTQAAIDQAIAADKSINGAVSCKEGCAACCRQSVQITDDEAKLLALVVKGSKLEIDRKLLEGQAAFEGDELAWWRQPVEKKTCVFLDANERCMVYPARPSACRKYFVVSPAEDCSKVSTDGSYDVKVKANYDAEILASAQLQLAGSGRIGPLPKMLLAELAASP